MAVRAVRGAIQVDANEREQILEASSELVTAVLSRNDIDPADLISVVFTVTLDLNAGLAATMRDGTHRRPCLSRRCPDDASV